MMPTDILGPGDPTKNSPDPTDLPPDDPLEIPQRGPEVIDPSIGIPTGPNPTPPSPGSPNAPASPGVPGGPGRI